MNKSLLIRFSASAMKSLRSAYAKDRDHFVVLDQDFCVGTFRPYFHTNGQDLPILPYTCPLFEITPNHQLWLKKTTPETRGSCDGATFAPDKLAGVDLAAGYIPHDFLYTELENMASDPDWQRVGWTEKSLRHLFDIVLGKMIAIEEKKKRPDGKPWISRLYYGAVRRLGGLYHTLAHIVVLLALAGVAAGCGEGCMAVPDGVFDPSGDEPVYHVEPITENS